MKKKQIFSGLIAGAMALTLLAGCGSSSSSSSSSSGSGSQDSGSTTADAASTDANTLTVWAWDQNFNIKAMKEAEKIYQKDNPDFKLNINEVSWDDMQTNLGTILGSGDMSQLPDILLLQDFAFQKYAQNYPDMFTDLTDSGIDFSQFPEGKLAESTVDGKNLGVPFDSGAEVACYRTDILEQAGYTVDDLTDIDWDRFDEIGKDVKEKTGYSLMSVQAGSSDFIIQMLQSTGGELWQDGKPYFKDNDTLKKCFETYEKLYNDGVLVTANSWDEYIATFTSGTTAGTINGCWILASVESAEDQSGKWALTDMPKMVGTDGATNYSNQGGSTWVVTSNCKDDKAKLAEDFFSKTFAGSTELYDTILPSTGALATYIPAAQSDVYNQPVEFFGGDTIFAKIADYSSKTPAFDRGVYYTEANGALATAVTNVLSGSDLISELSAAEDTVSFNMGQ